MKKDKEWLKNEMLNLRHNRVLLVTIGEVMELIDQLDEPEVLTQEWIDEHVVHVRGLGDILEAVSVENLLVPKQKLPVMPHFVADFIEKWKSECLTMSEWFDFNCDDEEQHKVFKWLYDNDYEENTIREHLLINAARYGYEVEKEQKYYTLDSEDIPLLERWGNKIQGTTTELSIYEKGRDSSRFELTEQEIKDYDPRY